MRQETRSIIKNGIEEYKQKEKEREESMLCGTTCNVLIDDSRMIDAIAKYFKGDVPKQCEECEICELTYYPHQCERVGLKVDIEQWDNHALGIRKIILSRLSQREVTISI